LECFVICNYIPFSIKKICISALFFIVQIFIAIKNGIGTVCMTLCAWLWRTAKILIRNPLILFYKGYRKIITHLQGLGIELTQPGLYLISGKIVSHLLIIGIAIIILAANIHNRSVDSDTYLPNNILAHLIIENEDFIIEESLLTTSDATYTPLDALRSPTTIEEEDLQLGMIPGDVALNPGALIKPILPDIEERRAEPQRTNSYAVTEGDTLSTISRRFGLRTETLLWANNLRENAMLRIGQKITIPPTDGIMYAVRRGDTIERIARLYKADPEKIRSFNNIPGDRIAIGQTLMIPGGSRPSQVIQPAPPRTIAGRIRDILSPQPKVIETGARLLWPTTARRITQYFGWRHTGVDIAGPVSNKNLAADAGVVVISGWQRGYGNTVVIDHGGGMKTRYAHNSTNLVNVGETVKRGQVVAQMGSTGRSTGPHVHFEVTINGKRVNPLSYIR
jgi:murein DD-endopeptidase MepM/ murein hydrolase activator NlpD